MVPGAREAVMNRDDRQPAIELPGGGSLGYARFGDPAGVPCLQLAADAGLDVRAGGAAATTIPA